MENLDQKIIELMDLFDDEQVTTADKIDRPQQALDREAYSDFMKRNPMAGGGMLVQPGFGGTRQGYAKDKKKPTTTLDKYQNILDDFNLLVKESLRVNDGTNLPKDIKQYVNNYTFADGTKAKYSTYANLIARRSNPKYTKSLKPPVDVVKVKLAIMDNLITESNRGNKATNLTTLAKKVNWTDKDISNYKRQGKIKRLETSVDKVDKVYKNFFNNLDAPLENFFNPIEKMSKETGLNRNVVSTLLNKNPNYTDEGKKLFKSLGTFALKGKYAEQGLTIGQFLDDYENRLFIGENGLLSMRNYNKPTSAIVIDAYRHWNQGGKQIEWINPPKLDKQGNLISLEDAQFKYTGPNSSNTIWSASGSTVNGVKSKSIAIFGKDAPEFQKVFKDYEDIFRLENEIKPHPVTGKPTKMIDISKEAYNIGKGSSFGTSTLARDHVNIIKDVFGNDPEYGTRILPRRINEYAGALKTIEQATKKGIGKNYTQNKIDKIYEKMGYNFTKSYDQILNGEYNLATKVFNKFQAAGWGFDQSTNRWVIKEGFDVETAKNIDARGNPKNPNKILQSPFKIVEEREAPKIKKTETPFRKPVGTDGPRLGSLDIPSMFRKLSPTTRKLVGFGGGTVLPEVLFYQLDKANRMSKGVSEKEAAAGALESGTLGAYTNKAYMEELKKVAESMNIDSGAFDSAYNLNVLSKSFEQNSKNVDAQIATALENQDIKTAEELRVNFNKYLARIKPEAERLRNDIEERVTGGSPLTMAMGRGNVTDEQYSKPFYDMQDVALEKLKKEKQKVFDTQKRQVDTSAGNIGEGFYQAFDTLTQGAKNLLKGRIIPFGPDRLRPLESEREKEARYLKEMDPRELFLYNKARGFTYDNPITEADLSNLQYEQPGLFSKGGRAGFKFGTRKGILKLIDESVKKTPKDITLELDKLIKKTLDEDLFDKKDRIIDNINAKISRAKAKGLDSQEIGEGQIEFYDDITKSNFRTKTGPFFDYQKRKNKAGGGILKQAGDSSGPPPESGPMSEGLQGLMKRGMKI
jgi:hypothetical protein